MTTLKDCLTEQNCTGNLIQRLIPNLKKKGTANITITAVNARLAILHQYWETFQQIHRTILAFPDAEKDAYIIEDHYSNVETPYLDTHARLLEYIDELTLTRAAPESKDTLTQPNPAPATTFAPQPAVPVQLPRINLPRFSGDYTEWDSFSDMFLSLIDQNLQLSNVQKLHYLKLSLGGEASHLLTNIIVTGDNYQSAWNVLVDRYQNKRLQLHTHLTKLSELPCVTKESVHELKLLLNGTQEIVRALENLKRPVDHWDGWLIFNTLQRLDKDTKKSWESHLDASDAFPDFKKLVSFLNNRIRMLEMTSPSNILNSKSNSQYVSTKRTANSFHATTGNSTLRKCSYCKGEHYITQCNDFKRLSTTERKDNVYRLRLCINCLSFHAVKDCCSEKRCFTCKGQHNTLLHIDNSHSQVSIQSTPKPGGSGEGHSGQFTQALVLTHISTRPQISKTVLLATALVTVISPSGQTMEVRALLDQGSEASFITERVVQFLRLQRQKVQVPLIGIGCSASVSASQKVQFVISSSRNPNLRLEVDAFVLSRLTNTLPSKQILPTNLPQLRGIQLADPEYHRPSHVTLILGSDVYGLLLRDGLIKFASSHIVAQNTSLGWILSGMVHLNSEWRAAQHAPTGINSFPCTLEASLADVLQRFWEVEDIEAGHQRLSPEDQKCEDHFKTSHTRTPDGRYVVRLPVKEEIPLEVEETKKIAVSMLQVIERRFKQNSKLTQEYKTFMSDYGRLGHMEKVIGPVERPIWYIPHHGILQSSGFKTKLRVVFDASRRTASGNSLNSCLLAGPPLQNDLSLILLQWRQYQFVFTADIVKMFRQILVHPEDQDLQRIVWRNDVTGAIDDFRLKTVTYGTTCAPYLALRTLRQLAEDEKHHFPRAASSLCTQSYVDDIFSGADTETAAQQMQQELIALLAAGGFQLDKWAANDASLLKGIHSKGSQADLSRSFDIFAWDYLDSKFGRVQLPNAPEE